MSNYEYEDDEFDFDTTSNELVKQLRKAAKQKDKELAEMREQFANLNKSARERAIKDALAARGVNSKIASFIPQDIDPTEESVSKWLEDYADVFGIQTEQTQAKPNVDPAHAAAYQRMTGAVDAGFTPEHGQDIHNRMMNATSKEELANIIAESGL